MLPQYLKALLAVSSRLAWTAANGLIGGLLGGGAMIFHGVLHVVPGMGTAVDTANWCLSFLMYAAGVWGALFVGSLIFVSPYLIWREEREARLRADRAHRLVWECKTWSAPTLMPPDGELLEINPHLIGDGDNMRPALFTSRRAGTPGSSVGRGKIYATMTWKCVLTNFGDQILFDLKMTFKANFFEKIATSCTSSQRGKYITKAELVLPITSLEIGKERAFIVYIQSNDSFHFSNVEMPQKASYRASGDARENIDVFVPDAMRILECGSAIFETTDND